jgi:hypothetical protein
LVGDEDGRRVALRPQHRIRQAIEIFVEMT